ncbi:hypothetical protein GCM10011428_84560 [Streptomyces violaceus]
MLVAADQQEAYAGVVGEGRQQRGVAGVDLLLAHPVRDVREGDQAEVAGGQHDRLGTARGAVPLAALLDRDAQGGTHGGAGLRPLRVRSALRDTGNPQPARTRSPRVRP